MYIKGEYKLARGGNYHLDIYTSHAPLNSYNLELMDSNEQLHHSLVDIHYFLKPHDLLLREEWDGYKKPIVDMFFALYEPMNPLWSPTRNFEIFERSKSFYPL